MFKTLCIWGMLLVSQNIFAQITATPQAICNGANVVMTIPPQPFGSIYQWQQSATGVAGSFANVPSSGTSATYSTNMAQFYQVLVTLVGVPTPTIIGPILISTAPAPVSNFTFVANNGCSNIPVAFTSTSTGAGLTYSWDFGNSLSGSNNTSNLQNPIHRFITNFGNSTQTFNVKLVITNTNGCKDSITKQVTKIQLPDPKLGGTGSVMYNGKNYFTACGVSTSLFTFVNQSTTILSNTNYEIQWGDGTPNFNASNFAPQTHTYPIGNYSLLYIVTSNNSCKDTGYYYVFVGSNPAGSISSPGSTFGCTGNTFSFPFSNILNNSPGTEYIITVNDGSAPVTYTQANVPSDFIHVFNQSSCGLPPNNTYTVSYTFTNPCSETSGTISGIRISQKAIPNFTISPKDTVCQNTVVTITSNGLGGLIVPSSGSAPCTNGKSLWSISPSTGWNILSGILGNDSGFPLNTDFWTTGSSSLQISFTTPGTYTIKLKSGTNSCGIDSLIKTICINPTPTAAFIIDNNIGCAPLTVNTTNNSNTPLCGNNTYQWAVTFQQTTGCTPNVSGINYLNGTSSTSFAPQFQFTTPGVYTISLITKSSGGLCISTMVTNTVTVKGKPVVTLGLLPASICTNNSITPSAVVSCNLNGPPLATYAWSFPGGTPSTSSTLNPGNISYATSGSYTISLAVTNECGTTTANTPITIKEVPIATLPANVLVCGGENVGPLSFMSSMASSSFSWTNTNTSIGLGASGTSNPIAAFNAINNTASQISGTVNVTVTNNLCSSTNNFLITVNPKPVLPIVTTPVNYCVGAMAIPLSATATAGNTLLWYTTPTLGTGSATAPTPSTASSGATIYYVSQINTTTNCEGPRAAITVNVNLLPTITVTSTNPLTCGASNGTITISGLNPSTTYTVSYVKNAALPTLITRISNASGIITITGLSLGTYSNIFVTLNFCNSNIATVTLTDPTTPSAPTASNDGPICSGLNLNLMASTIAGATYNWSGPVSLTQTQNPIIANATVAASGTYNVTVTVNGCTSMPATTTVLVNPSPNVPTATSNSQICDGANLNLFAVPSTSATYEWTGPNGFTSAAQNTSIAPANTSAAGLYKVIASIGTCKDSSTTSVTIKPLPVITATKIDPATCSSSTGSITISGLVIGNSYTIYYIKNGATPITFPINATAITYTIGNLTQGSYTNIFVILNGCSSNIIASLILSDPTQPLAPMVLNNGPICSGTTLNLTSTTIIGATYAWTGPAGFTSPLQNPTLNITPTTASGNYNVIATVNGCASPHAITAVVINPTPTVSIVGTNSPVCAGNNILLTASSSTGATFSWTGPNTFINTNQNPTIIAATLSNGGLYSVVATLGLCTSNASTTVIVKPTPILTTANLIQPANCGVANGSITLVGLTALTPYEVSYIKDGGVAVVLNLPTNATGELQIANLAAGVYTNIFVTLNACPSNLIGPFTLVNPTSPNTPVINTNTAICAGVTLTLNASTTSAGAATFNWTGPNGFIFVGQATTIPITVAANAGTYFVTATINNCISAQASSVVVINPLPAAPSVVSPISYCVTAPAIPLTATATTFGNPLFWYTTNTGGTFSIVAPTPNTNTVGNTNFYVSQQTAQGCEGSRATLQVVINDNAKAVFNPTTITACPPFIITPAIVGLQQFPLVNNSYNWYANNVFIGTGINFPGYTINTQNDSVSIKLVATSLFGCKADSVTKKFFTFKVPSPSFTKNITQGCAPLSVTFVNTTPFINDYTYSWDFGDGQTSTLQQPGTIIFPQALSFRDTFYIVKLKVVTLCNTVIFKDSVLVKSKPKALFTPNNVNGCSPMRVRFTNTSLGNGNTYFWNFGDGQTFTTTVRDTFTHIFYTGVIDTFKVKLKVINSCGVDSITYNIITAPNNIFLNYAINGTAQYGCAPHTVAFFNNSSGAGSFQWNFGDGITTITSNNVDTVYHTYNLPGIYPVIVTAFNNCTDTAASRTISVFAKPIPAFTANKYRVCIGEQVLFTETSTGATSRLWKFGDNTFSSTINPSHAYAAAGFYTVKLLVYNANPSGNVCSDSTFRIIEVVPSLPGNISFTTNGAGCAPHTITFNNLDLPAASVVWDFGDGQTGVGNTVTHTYNIAGVYTVHVVAISTTGCTFISDKIITIAGPAGAFIYSGGFVCSPSSVFFQATASATNTYLWNFGDGTTQTTTTSSIYHPYNNPGTYLPSVTLQNTAGCNILLNGLVPIKVDKIIGGFTAAQSQSCGFTTVNFTDTATAFFGKALVKWRYGDGQTGIGSNVTHNYAATGNYNIEMIVIGISGCTDTTRKTITVAVKTKPTATIAGPVSKCVLETITFVGNINSIDSVSIKKWNLSNGATGVGNNFIYNFANAGTYTLQLIAGTINGCFDTATHTIIIKPVPIVTASADITLCKGNSANLLVTGNAISYQWNPIGGLSCTSCVNPVASPLLSTPYTVSGTNALGCTANDTVVVTVIQPMNLLVSADENICIGKSAQLLVSGGATYIWSPAISLNNATLSNPIATPTATTIYRVVGYDGQNCFTDTGFVKIGIGQYPTVNLGPDLLLSSGTQLQLTTQIVNGPIQTWLWNPSTNLSCNTCPLPIATIKNDITYAVKVTTAFGCSASDTINIKVFCSDAQVFIPNGFSPDGDGLNDILMVRGTGILSVKSFVIFNRWGEIVFEKNNFPPNNLTYGWDGKIKGRPATPDVFVYTAEVICDNGTPFKYKGNISLLK